MSARGPDQQYVLSGEQFRRLMRLHAKTIGGIAREFDVPQTRIRQLRERGARGFAAEELHYWCTGRWPEPAGKSLSVAPPRGLTRAPVFAPTADELAAAFAADEHAWLGGDACEVDDIFAGTFEDYLDDLSRELDEESYCRIPGHPAMYIAQTLNSESLLLQGPNIAGKLDVVGYYTGPQLILRPDVRGRGLGVTLIVAHSVFLGESPQLSYSSVGYSRAGLAAHQAAWQRGRELLGASTPTRQSAVSLSPGM